MMHRFVTGWRRIGWRDHRDFQCGRGKYQGQSRTYIEHRTACTTPEIRPVVDNAPPPNIGPRRLASIQHRAATTSYLPLEWIEKVSARLGIHPIDAYRDLYYRRGLARELAQTAVSGGLLLGARPVRRS